MRELSQKYLKHHFKYSRHFDSNKIKFIIQKTYGFFFFITILPQRIYLVYLVALVFDEKQNYNFPYNIYWRPTYGTIFRNVYEEFSFSRMFNKIMG